MAWSALLLLVILVALDMQNLASRWGRIIELGDETTTDFTILVPIFGDPRYFRNGDYLERYRQNTLLAVNVDSPKMERFVADLRSQGWRVHAAHLTGRVSCPELVFDALQKVTTRYVIRMDGDTVSREHPGRAVAAVRAADADLCSVKVTVSRRKTLIEKLQAVEYDMSMLGRHNRAWMTSGACMMARTAALRVILASHSYWFPGEDIETGVIAKHYGLSVRHLNMRFYTDAPETFRAWFRQRRMWWSGSFRMAFVNAGQTLRFPLTFVYTVCVVWLLWIAKCHELLDVRQHRRDPSIRPAPVYGDLLLLELVGPQPVDGGLPLLRPLPGARHAVTRSHVLPVAVGQARHAEAARSLRDRNPPRRARPSPVES